MKSVWNKVKRPWGYFQILQKGRGWQLKVLYIAPKQAFSLQKHSYRSELWTIAQGKGTATLGKKKIVLKQGDSIFIPKGAIHRCENCTRQDLFIVEVQYGKKILENDIVRLEDNYGRAKKRL